MRFRGNFSADHPDRRAVQWDESTLIALIRTEVRRVMDEASRVSERDGETMDVRELTALLGLNRKTVYGLIACGEIPGCGGSGGESSCIGRP